MRILIRLIEIYKRTLLVFYFYELQMEDIIVYDKLNFAFYYLV